MDEQDWESGKIGTQPRDTEVERIIQRIRQKQGGHDKIGVVNGSLAAENSQYVREIKKLEKLINAKKRVGTDETEQLQLSRAKLSKVEQLNSKLQSRLQQQIGSKVPLMTFRGGSKNRSNNGVSPVMQSGGCSKCSKCKSINESPVLQFHSYSIEQVSPFVMKQDACTSASEEREELRQLDQEQHEIEQLIEANNKKIKDFQERLYRAVD